MATKVGTTQAEETMPVEMQEAVTPTHSQVVMTQEAVTPVVARLTHSLEETMRVGVMLAETLEVTLVEMPVAATTHLGVAMTRVAEMQEPKVAMKQLESLPHQTP